VEPVERYPLWKDEQDGVWEISLLGLDVGKYYSFNVDGRRETRGLQRSSADRRPVRPRAAHAHNNTIVMDPDETNRWFGGWTDEAYAQVARHERSSTNCTSGHDHASVAGVPPESAGKYEGLRLTADTATGLGYLKDLGSPRSRSCPRPSSRTARTNTTGATRRVLLRPRGLLRPPAARRLAIL